MLKYKLNINNINTGNTITLKIDDNFIPILDQQMLLKNNLNVDVINEVIDYEKVKITPVHYSGNTPTIVNDIKLTPNFYIGDNWTTNGTNLSTIGYVEDDVKYNKLKLSKTFLRLSYYDSDNLQTQNLLYFSSIFVDSGKLFGEYISGVEFENLTLKFIVENPMVQYSKSSEGFNIYLFKNDLKKNENKTIYVKVELNNALNGSTSLFLSNRKQDGSGYTLKELKDNLFIKINIKYEERLNEYVYFLDEEYSSQNINIQLYQAKVK